MNLLKCISICFKSTADQESPSPQADQNTFINEIQSICQRSDIWELTNHDNITFEVRHRDYNPETPRFEHQRTLQLAIRLALSTDSSKLSVKSNIIKKKKRRKKTSKSLSKQF